MLASQRRYREAMDELLEILKRAKDWREGEARKQLLALFTMAAASPRSSPSTAASSRARCTKRAPPMQRTLISIGLADPRGRRAVAVAPRLGLGRLPGDLRVQTEHGVFYFPLVTCLVVSVVLSLVLWLLRR